MAINFPSNPSVDQVYTFEDRTWRWNGEYWQSITATIGYAGSAAGGSGVVILKYKDTFTISNPGGGLTFTTDSSTVAGYKISSFTAGTGTIQWS